MRIVMPAFLPHERVRGLQDIVPRLRIGFSTIIFIDRIDSSYEMAALVGPWGAGVQIFPPR